MVRISSGMQYQTKNTEISFRNVVRFVAKEDLEEDVGAEVILALPAQPAQQDQRV